MKIRGYIKKKYFYLMIVLFSFPGFIFSYNSFQNTEHQYYTKETIKSITKDGITHYIDVYSPPEQELADNNQYNMDSNTNKTNLKPAVILIHGIAVSKEFFANFAIEFARRNIIAVCPELRGHGISEGALPPFGMNPPQSWKIGLPNVSIFRNEINATLNYLSKRTDVDMNRISLIGHSMGGGAALDQNIQFPNRFLSTVAIAPLPIEGNTLNNTRNLLLMLGQFDEAFTLAQETALFKESFSPIKPPEDIIFGKIYGDFNKGTARKFLIIPNADHASEYMTPEVLQESILWVMASFGTIEIDQQNENQAEQEIALVFDSRMSTLQIQIIFAILFFFFSGFLFTKIRQKEEVQNNQEKQDDILNNEKKRKIYSWKNWFAVLIIGTFGGIISFLSLQWTGYLISAAIIGPFMGMALGLGFVYRKFTFSEFNKYFPINKKKHKENIKKEIILGLISVGSGIFLLYMLDISAGRYFLNLIPAIFKFPIMLMFSLIIAGVLYVDTTIFYSDLIESKNKYDNSISEKKNEINDKEKIMNIIGDIKSFLKHEIPHFLMQLNPIFLALLSELLFIDNAFPLMFASLMIGILFLLDLTRYLWIKRTKKIIYSLWAWSAFLGPVLVALSPLVMI